MYAVIDLIRERKLIALAKQGDRTSFDALCRRHSSGLHSYIHSRVSADQVEDIVQDVWLTSWERIRVFAGRSSYRSWVLGIAINKIRESRRKPVELTNIEEIVPSNSSSNANDESDNIVLRVVIQDALSKLPDQQRDVVDLYYFSGLTLPEIATSLDRNLNTVKYQFYAAHEKIANILDPVRHPQLLELKAEKRYEL